MENDSQPLRYFPNWSQPQGKTSRKGDKVHIHPLDLICYVQRKEGIHRAGELAIKLITKKYFRQLDESFSDYQKKYQ